MFLYVSLIHCFTPFPVVCVSLLLRKEAIKLLLYMSQESFLPLAYVFFTLFSFICSIGVSAFMQTILPACLLWELSPVAQMLLGAGACIPAVATENWPLPVSPSPQSGCPGD